MVAGIEPSLRNNKTDNVDRRCLTRESHVNISKEAIQFIRYSNIQGSQYEIHVLQTNGNTCSLELVKSEVQPHVFSIKRRDKSFGDFRSASRSFGRAKVVSKLRGVLFLTV